MMFIDEEHMLGIQPLTYSAEVINGEAVTVAAYSETQYQIATLMHMHTKTGRGPWGLFIKMLRGYRLLLALRHDDKIAYFARVKGTGGGPLSDAPQVKPTE